MRKEADQPGSERPTILLKGRIGRHVALIGIAQHDPDRKSFEHRTPGHPAGAQLGAEQPGRLVGAQGELMPQLP
jgi:hypothetical protein